MSFLGLEYANPVRIELIRKEYVNESIRGARTGTVFGPGRWMVQITLEPQPFSDASHRLAVHRAKHGSLNSFSMTMPQIASADFDDANTYGIHAAATAGAASVTLTSSADVTLPVGRFIRFSNHTKVYQVDGSSDYTVTSAGVAVSIVPELVTAVGTTHTWIPAPDLTCRYDANSRGFFDMDRRSVVNRTLTVVEA